MTTADRNPFRVARMEALAYRAPDFAWEDFLANLAAHGYRGAVVGPHGSGKTTLLLEARERLAAVGIPVRYGFLNEETPKKGGAALGYLRDTPGDALLFLDGAEQLDPVTWLWLRWRSRSLRGFVITAHAPGRLPTLYRTATAEETLRALLEELVPGEAEARWPQAQAHFRRCGGNIREVFFALYDTCAREGGPD